ncbi:MAG: HlyD family secretion protein [Hyphomicrobiaceae bacterium]|nr:HlyD family secretion protein [Hyphomicrobiaceae bacterium]
MLELLLCSLFTIFPDYLYRRYSQGKRLGHEINLYSVWYELRYGITACLMLTVALITVIFYHHPGSTNVTAVFRTIPILPEINGRVEEVFVGVSGDVKQGDPIVKLDSARQEASLDVAKQRIAEVEAGIVVAKSDIAKAEGQIQQAQSALDNARDELSRKQELSQRNANVVTQRELERLQLTVAEKQGALSAAQAAKDAAVLRVSTLLPAEKESAAAALRQAQVELDKMVIRAGVEGRIEQFTMRKGDYVNPFMRPAGVLVPKGAGRGSLVAGFGQIEGQVLKKGMIVEASCVSKPWTIIPMVISYVQDYIASGQFRASDQLVDVSRLAAPGTITVFLEPLYDGGLEGVLPGSSCFANAYSNNHEKLASPDIGLGSWIYLHIVDTVGIVHAMLLRLQTLLLPVKQLVLSGAH